MGGYPNHEGRLPNYKGSPKTSFVRKTPKRNLKLMKKALIVTRPLARDKRMGNFAHTRILIEVTPVTVCSI